MEQRDLLAYYDLVLRPDPSRTVLRPFDPSDAPDAAPGQQTRAGRIAERVTGMAEEDLRRVTEVVVHGLGQRHRDVEPMLRKRFDEIRGGIGDRPISDAQALLIGAYFIEEYSFEAAALFNPSIVPLHDQTGCPEGGIRFFLSLRGIGEGHISSVTFRSGSWVPGSAPVIDPPSCHAAPPVIESGKEDDGGGVVKLRWDNIEDVSEAVLFPVVDRHRQGIEDARFVRFVEDDGSECYYATVTAFSGREIRGELIRATSIGNFELHPLGGKAAENKGTALFPRRIDGRYVMLGRQDNENLWLMRSDDLFVWDQSERLLEPKTCWEFTQIGNCGSPVEIDEGWLVLTHGVGPARAYSIGACLLDKADPSKVLGRMTAPLLHPNKEEHDGYVPNVVYACGSLLRDRRLLIPYGVADFFTRFAEGSVDDILAAMS